MPLYVVPQIWAYSETIATSFGIFFLNSSQPVAAFFLSASVSGLTRKNIRNANIRELSPSSDPSRSGLIWLSEIRRWVVSLLVRSAGHSRLRSCLTAPDVELHDGKSCLSFGGGC